MKNSLFQSSAETRSEVEGVRRMISLLKSCDAGTRMAVGAGVNLANDGFTTQFAGIESFRNLPVEEQQRFWAELSDLELMVRSHKLGFALGIGLYRIWLTKVIAGRHREAEVLGQELTELGRRAGTI